jgi:hypothetical protein
MNLDTGLRIRLSIVALGLAVLHGCAGLTTEEQDAKRTELDQMGEKTIATLSGTEPEAGAALEKSIGYAVIDMTVTKIPVIGAGAGLGVIIDKSTGTHTYIKVTRFEVGGGWGAQKFKVIIFFFDEVLLKRASSGAWHFEAGAEASAGTASTEGTVTTSDAGYRAFKIVESGAVATVTIRAAYAQPYLE